MLIELNKKIDIDNINISFDKREIPTLNITYRIQSDEYAKKGYKENVLEVTMTHNLSVDIKNLVTNHLGKVLKKDVL